MRVESAPGRGGLGPAETTPAVSAPGSRIVADAPDDAPGSDLADEKISSSRGLVVGVTLGAAIWVVIGLLVF